MQADTSPSESVSFWRALATFISEMGTFARFIAIIVVFVVFSTVDYSIYHTGTGLLSHFMSAVNFFPYAFVGYLCFYPFREELYAFGAPLIKFPPLFGVVLGGVVYFFTYGSWFVVSTGGLPCLLPKSGACLDITMYFRFTREVVIPGLGSDASWKATLRSMTDFDVSDIFELIQFIVYLIPIALQGIARKFFNGPNLGYLVYGINYLSFLIYGCVTRAAVLMWSR